MWIPKEGGKCGNNRTQTCKQNDGSVCLLFTGTPNSGVPGTSSAPFQMYRYQVCY